MAEQVEPLSVPQALTATIVNGTAASGAWRKVTFGTVSGSGATINAAGDLAFTAVGPATLSVNITVQTNSPPGQVALARGFNGGAPVAIGTSITLDDTNPAAMTVGANLSNIGQTMQIYVFTTSVDPVNYSNGQLGLRWVLAFPSDASAPDYSATPPMPIDPGGDATTPPVVPGPGPGTPPNTGGNFPYTLVLPTFAFMPLVQGVKFNLSAVPPWNTPGSAPQPTPPPLLTMTRTPAFPAYPS